MQKACVFTVIVCCYLAIRFQKIIFCTIKEFAKPRKKELALQTFFTANFFNSDSLAKSHNFFEIVCATTLSTESVSNNRNKLRKGKQEIKKELDELVINEDQHENKNLEEKASKVGQSEDAVAVIKEFQKIIKSKKKNIIW